jgi:Protein of unknown function (DUF2971)
MNEPPEVAGPDGYPFAEPYGLIAHYTTASTAFEHILPGKLRLSPYRLMRDPAENKDILPNVAWYGDLPNADREVHVHIKAVRDRMRVLSLTRDAEDGGGSYRQLDCCWARPRMWEQYGDDHRGACLLFDPARLERAIREQWPDERTRHLRKVEYKREGSAEVYHRGLVADKILSAADPAEAVADYINANSDAYFFLKSEDFATEYEYRVVLAAGDGDYAWIDYGDSLVGVALGERFPEWQDLGAIRECENVGVTPGWIAWFNGRPRAFPRRPRVS